MNKLEVKKVKIAVGDADNFVRWFKIKKVIFEDNLKSVISDLIQDIKDLKKYTIPDVYYDGCEGAIDQYEDAIDQCLNIINKYFKDVI